MPYIIALLISLNLSLRAQSHSNWTPATLLSNGHDTLNVILYFKDSYRANPVLFLQNKRIRFIEEGKKKKKHIESTDVRYLQVGNEQYIQREGICFGYKLYHFEDSGKVILFSAFINDFWPSGNFDLTRTRFEYLIQKDSLSYLAARDLSIGVFKIPLPRYVYGNARFQELCNELFWDDPELAIKIRNHEEGYQVRDLGRIIKEYNRHYRELKP